MSMERLEAITETVLMLKRLAEYYETPEECVTWFTSPQPLINNEIPTDLIAQGRSIELYRVWDSLDAGVYI